MYYLTRKKKVRLRFSPNTTVTGHRQEKVAFAERKPLPRSTANSTVTACRCKLYDGPNSTKTRKVVRRVWHRVVLKFASFFFSSPDPYPSHRQCVFAEYNQSNSYRTLPDRPTVHNTRFPASQIQTLVYVLSQCLFLSIPLAVLQM
jgi:hypothetical protein